MTNRLLGLNQYGILLTKLNGHVYLEWEDDYELSPTIQSKQLLVGLSKNGIKLLSKQYGTIEDVLDRIDRVLHFLELDDLETVGGN